ncbi:hypothetical protein [Acidovorax sp. NB1]|uniref:hypothetical protein n=1 Tax=Acidovorax sp. NB1 TaxID=1943571 RepID=UPI0010E201F3|nr:hypothetical protein [Acidovorax sp. NB1]GDY36306.1 hypothetical protein ACINB_21980 [Acidovorax sp. NB1]
MNQTDDLKILRLQEEKKYINKDFVEGLASQLIDELVDWANDEIFASRGGELTFKITLGKPNAGIAIDPNDPLHPRMEFRLSLISDIYADAFSYPIVCRRLNEETDTLVHFNETERFRDCRVRFTSPLPELHESNVANLFRPVCETFVTLNLEARDRELQLQPDDVRCRFIMFELMLVWTFFHELGHAVQGHYRMRSKGASLVSELGFLEMEDSTSVLPDRNGSGSSSATQGKAVEPDLAAQARELMADADAMDQTLKYLVRSGRLNFNVCYLLLCSVGCMFQRFYNSYPANLQLSHARHPHPAIRDEASQLLSINWIADYLVASKNAQSREEVSTPLAYLSVRASLMTGLFRAHRIEKRESPEYLPSYMSLLLDGGDQQRGYIEALLPEIERQLPMICEYHLIEMHSLEYWFGFIKANVRDESTGLPEDDERCR